MLQKFLKSILENMAWIEELHQSGDDRWSTLKGILQGLDLQRSPTPRAPAERDGARCPICNTPLDANGLCPHAIEAPLPRPGG